MARRASLIKARPKKERKTRSEVYMVNLKYLGEEPTFKAGQPLSFSERARAYTWYGSMADMAEAREWLSDYLDTKGRKEDVKRLKSVPDNLFPYTCAWIGRMAMRGAPVDESTAKFFDNRLREAFADRSTDDEKKEEKKPAAEKPNIQDRIKEKLSDIVGELEGVMDDHMTGKITEFDAYEFCQKMQLPSQYATKVASKYAEQYEELELAVSGEDEQVNEGYKSWGKKWTRERLAFLEKIMSDLLRYGQNAKKLRTPRKKKPQSVEKKLKYFRYKKEDQETKLASVPPEQVVGAQELWTYNVKYKTLTVFRAIDRGGLDIKRSSIVNYDEKASFTYRTGRQGEKLVQSALSGGKLVLRKLGDGLKTATLQDRTNENVILLRIVK